MVKRRTGRWVLPATWLCLLLLGGLILVGCGDSPKKEGPNPTERIWAEIVPQEGTATEYGIPLSLKNTQQFIDWDNSIELSAEERAIRDAALAPPAPCCDDFPMSDC